MAMLRVRKRSGDHAPTASAAVETTLRQPLDRTNVPSRPALFRREVLEFQQHNRQWGRVVPLQPLSTKFMVWCAVAASACVVAFLFFAQYARKETAIGYLEPVAGSARVFAAQPGTISAVYVKQGERVDNGQPLLAVETGQISADGGEVNTAMLQTLQQQKEALTTQIAEQVRRDASERDRLTAQQQELEGEIATFGTRMDMQRSRITLLEQIVAGGAVLQAKGLVSLVEQKRREAELLDQRETLVTMNQDLIAQQGKLSQVRFDLAQLPFKLSESIQSVRNDLANVLEKIAEINGRRAYIVRAPIGGTISLLQASVGQAADPHRVQLEIVPGGSRLEARLFIPTSAIGFVETGQDVKVLYDAFPYQRFGTFRGKITSVSHSVLLESDVAAPVKVTAPVYTATVALDRSDIVVHGKKVELEPDMSLRADIILERRKLIDWIVNPLRHIGLER